MPHRRLSSRQVYNTLVNHFTEYEIKEPVSDIRSYAQAWKEAVAYYEDHAKKENKKLGRFFKLASNDLAFLLEHYWATTEKVQNSREEFAEGFAQAFMDIVKEIRFT